MEAAPSLKMSFDYNKLKDPGYFAENRVAAYSGYIMGSSFEPLIEASRDINGNITSCYVAMEPVMAVEGTEPLLRQHAPVDLSGGYFFTSALTDPSLDADFLNVYFSKESFDLIQIHLSHAVS